MINPQQFIWFDGQIVDWDKANCHVLSHGLHYGSGVFEGERAYRGQIFKMSEHHQRLHRSAQILGFTIPYSIEQINEAAVTVLAANGLQDRDAYVRPVAWHGSGWLSISTGPSPVHLAVATWVWPTLRERGVPPLRLIWADWARPAPNTSPSQAKATGQYIIATMSKNQAEARGYNDALMLDYRGYVAECTGSNIFMVKDGALHTPIADCFLDGITRKTVIELARREGLAVQERHILPTEILNADEVFITGSAAEVHPVGEIDGTQFAYGPITKRLSELYFKAVGSV